MKGSIDNNRYFLKKKDNYQTWLEKWLPALEIEETEINTKITNLSQVNMSTIKRVMYIQWKRKQNHLWGCKWKKTFKYHGWEINFL